MPCLKVNPPTWHRFAALQVKWKGKANHVRTCAQPANYAWIMRIDAHNTQVCTMSICLSLFSARHPHSQHNRMQLAWENGTNCACGDKNQFCTSI